IWLISKEGGEAKQLTTFTYGATNPIWSKDGSFLLFSALLEDDDTVENQIELTSEEHKQAAKEKAKQPLIVKNLKYKSDANGFHDDKKTHIILYDLKKDSFKRLTKKHVNHAIQDISRDGKQILFTANYDEDADYQQKQSLLLLNRETNEIK